MDDELLASSLELISAHLEYRIPKMTIYYVDASAAGGGDGSITTPWNSVTQVNSGAGLNDTVNFNRGDTFSGVTLTSGADGIIYQAYGEGANPIIDGLTQDRAFNSNGADGCSVDGIDFSGGNGSFQLVYWAVASDGGTQKNSVITCQNGGSGFYFQGFGAIEIENVTVNYGTSSGNLYPFIIFCNGVTTLDATNITVTPIGAATAEHPVYIRVASGSLTGTIDGLDLTGVDTAAATGQVFFQHSGTLSITDMTVVNTVGKVVIGAGGASPVCTIENLVVQDGTDHGIHCPAAGATLTLINPQIERCAEYGVVAVAPVKVTIFDGLISDCGKSGVEVTTSGTIECHDLTVSDNGSFGLIFDGTTVTNLYRVKALRNAQDGFNWTGSGTHYTEGCIADSNGTTSIAASGDGYSAHDTCTVHNFGCLAMGNLGGGFTHINTTQGSIKNCTTYGNNKVAGSSQGNDVSGIRWQTTNTIEIVDNILMNDDYAIYIDAGTVAGATMTIDRNLYYNTNTYPTESGNSLPFLWGTTDYNYADWVTQSGEADSINADPKFVDTTSFELAISSPAIGSSDQNWTPSAPRPAGANGEPYPDRSIDKGGNQSQYSCGHPTKVRGSGTCI